MEIPDFVRKRVEELYPELGEVTMDYIAAASQLGGVKNLLKSNGVSPMSGLITHVGKIERGILFGITMRGFTDADESYESYKKAQHRPALMVF